MVETQNMDYSLIISGKSTHLIKRQLLRWPTSLYVSERMGERVREETQRQTERDTETEKGKEEATMVL